MAGLRASLAPLRLRADAPESSMNAYGSSFAVCTRLYLAISLVRIDKSCLLAIKTKQILCRVATFGKITISENRTNQNSWPNTFYLLVNMEPLNLAEVVSPQERFRRLSETVLGGFCSPRKNSTSSNKDEHLGKHVMTTNHSTATDPTADDGSFSMESDVALSLSPMPSSSYLPDFGDIEPIDHHESTLVEESCEPVREKESNKTDEDSADYEDISECEIHATESEIEATETEVEHTEVADPEDAVSDVLNDESREVQWKALPVEDSLSVTVDPSLVQKDVSMSSQDCKTDLKSPMFVLLLLCLACACVVLGTNPFASMPTRSTLIPSNEKITFSEMTLPQNAQSVSIEFGNMPLDDSKFDAPLPFFLASASVIDVLAWFE
jgi:hypothetical protein